MSVRLSEVSDPESGVLLCFSHLRWSWVYQRPQHLLTRAARDCPVYYFEEPIFDSPTPRLSAHTVGENIVVLQPHLPGGMPERHIDNAQRNLLDAFIESNALRLETLWYYTPMALTFTRHLKAQTCVFDCMDELTAFAGAPLALRLLERQLMQQCDVVFTGGWSLYEAKMQLHANCHAMSSSVDVAHFSRARIANPEPASLAGIPHPRIGYCGVIDERIDLGLIATVAAARPDWQLVFIGPVTKIDESSLPRGANIHYLGARAYDELPTEMAGWDAAWMPFAMNESTRYISPTKTPEYLAAGLQVVSTPVPDVARSWGADQLVHIAYDCRECIDALAQCLLPAEERWRMQVDRALAQLSWDNTWNRMQSIISRSAEAAA
jgi:UDP-galactopyranose mutase